MGFVLIKKYLKLVILAAAVVWCKVYSAAAAEITAIDFNGNVIGQVISTGMVINADGENIGYITADSLIVDNDNEIIGGVVPQGVAIGMEPSARQNQQRRCGSQCDRQTSGTGFA